MRALHISMSSSPSDNTFLSARVEHAKVVPSRHDLHSLLACHAATPVVSATPGPRGCIHQVDAKRLPRMSMSSGTSTTIWRATSRSATASCKFSVAAVTTA
jgi:hypothetical protein